MALALKHGLDKELDRICKFLLKRLGDTNVFINETAQEALLNIHRNVTLNKFNAVIVALTKKEKNPKIRSVVALILSNMLEENGINVCRSCPTLLPYLVIMSSDSNPTAREAARKAISTIILEPSFQTVFCKQVDTELRQSNDKLIKLIKMQAVPPLEKAPHS